MSPRALVPLSLSLALGAAVALLAGCAPAQVRLPDGFAAESVAYEASGVSPRRHGQPIQVGPYAVRDFRDGGTYSQGASVGRAGWRHDWRGWSFTLESPDAAPVVVRCEGSRSALVREDSNGETEIDLGGVESPALGCGLQEADSGATFALELVRRGERLHGRLDGPAAAWQVRSLHGLEGTPLSTGEPVGFAFGRGEATTMVLDTTAAGRVLMAGDPDPRQRALLAAAAVALMTAGDAGR